MARWLVDGTNVMGSRPDGWWRDRRAAMQRIVTALDDLADETGDEVLVIFDGRDRDLQATRVAVGYAPHADDAITAEAAPGTTVVTSDRELRGRVEERGAAVTGSGTFRSRLGI